MKVFGLLLALATVVPGVATARYRSTYEKRFGAKKKTPPGNKGSPATMPEVRGRINSVIMIPPGKRKSQGWHGAIGVGDHIYLWGGRQCPRIAPPSARQVTTLHQAFFRNFSVKLGYRPAAITKVLRCIVGGITVYR